jgi:phage terminase large subunit-like protein
MTDAEKVLAFIETYLLVPEGTSVGKPLVLEPFQKQFITEIYDNPAGTRSAILSIARKNGKSALIAAIMLAHVVGPMARQNSQVVSGAMSRDQAALVYSLASKMLKLQPQFAGLFRCVDSSKRIYGLRKGVEYRALAADGTTAHGLSPVLAILDEVGQVRGPMTPFIEAIVTSQGAHENSLLMTISTQASSDADLLSVWIDDAKRSGDPHTVCHVYAADAECDLLDKTQWVKANPALGVFRGEKDLEEQLKQASRIPAMEASARNLLLNQRISLTSLWLAPTVWKDCAAPIDMEVFLSGPVVMGLDLSSRSDLTAAVFAAKDDQDFVHLLPLVFAPEVGMEARELRDKAPYTTWVRNKQMVAVPGATIDYRWVTHYLQQFCESTGIEVSSIQFDRWRIRDLQVAAQEVGFGGAAEWVEVGQGYKDFSPRVEAFESALLQKRICHGAHPLLNMSASNAIVVRDPANNKKIDKSKSTLRIDPLVAAVMAAYPLIDGKMEVFDVSAMVA